MRLRLRTPGSAERPRLLVVPTGCSFEVLKSLACAKLGIAGCSAVLLGSESVVKEEGSTAPEIEAMDEISPDDWLIVVPRSGASSAAASSLAGPSAST